MEYKYPCPGTKSFGADRRPALAEQSITSSSSIAEVIEAIEVRPYTGWPEGWHTWENVKEAHRRLATKFAESIELPASFGEGRGIVTAGGGRKYFPSVWVLVHSIRECGCKLPIELFYKGEAEMDPYMIRLLAPCGVRCIDVTKMRNIIPARILNGWEIKPYAMLYTSFREALYIDADAQTMIDPTPLFDSEPYKATGAVFWPDYPTWNLSVDQWKTMGFPRPANHVPAVPMSKVAPWFGKEIPDNYECAIESAQMLYDKSRCWKEMRLAMWYCEHSDFYFHHFYGDKEAYHFAWRKLGTEYAMPKKFPDWRAHTIYQHDFGGNVMFAHRCQDKWNLDLTKNRDRPDVLGNNFGFAKVRELIKVWKGNMWKNENPTAAEILYAKALVGKHTYFFPTFPDYARTLELKGDGTVGVGAAGYERKWQVYEDGGQPILAFFGDKGELSATLRLASDGVWRGNWVLGQRIPIELWPPGHNPKSKIAPSQIVQEAVRPVTNKEEPPKVETHEPVPYQGDALLPYPAYYNAASMTKESRTWARAIPVGNKMLMCRMLADITMYVDCDDCSLTPHIALNGIWEPGVVHVLGKYMHPGWYCIDVGANQGYYTILMGQSALRGGRLMAIEPNPRMLHVLKRNLRIAGLTDITQVKQCAAGDKDDEEVTLCWNEYDFGGATTINEPKDDQEVVRCNSMTLDTLLSSWLRVDLIKIDAVGSEQKIWKGMKRVLKDNRDIVILMEWQADRYPDKKGFLDEIQADGFTIRFITDDGQLRQISAEEVLNIHAYRMLWLQR